MIRKEEDMGCEIGERWVRRKWGMRGCWGWWVSEWVGWVVGVGGGVGGE